MSSRKNIDQLYQRKFEGAEMEPPEVVWQNIASRLPEKKHNKRIIPLWIRYAGAAAVLLLLVNLQVEWFSPESSNSISFDTVTREEIHMKIETSSSGFNETMSQVSLELRELRLEKDDSGANRKSQETGSSGEKPSEIFDEGGHTEVVSAEFSGSGDREGGWTENIASNIPDSIKASEEISKGSAIALGEDTKSEIQEDIAFPDTSEENSLAQQLKDDFWEPKDESAEKAEGKMSISTRVAPVFYEHTGRENGMSAGNAGGATGEVSLSYGINLAYQVSDHLKIRSGIGKLDLSYSTPGVPMASVMESPFVSSDNDPALMSRQVEGDLRQQMDFIEVPMEVEYRILDRRIGLNLVAGGSTLFLNRNNLSMDTGMRTTDLGRAEDINDLNFSANLGLGLDYQLAPDLRLSLEPMFKYQLDSHDLGVRPYYMAVYSGFSFSF